MINSFLVSLVNEATQPVNPSSTKGNIYWPEAVQLKSYTGDAAAWHQLFFGSTTGYQKLAKSIALLRLVQASTLAPYIVRDDVRTTYTDEQLTGQLAGLAVDNTIQSLLDDVQTASLPTFLPSELHKQYRSALSPTDKLAALVCYYGVRW